MVAQQRKHDAATNNIANLNTPGFKMNTVVQRTFPEMLVSLVRANEREHTIGRLAGGVFAEESLPLFMQGDVISTGNATDLALVSDLGLPGIAFDSSGRGVNAQGERVYQPQAFFTVQGAGGEERYTRDGKFSIDDNGNWVSPTGYLLIGVNGQPVNIGDHPGDVFIAEGGQIMDTLTGLQLAGPNGEPLALRISVIENPYDLIREGDGNFRLDEGAPPARLLAAGENAQIMQGYMERSNVDAATATVDMMTAARAYEANQKIIQYYDRSLEKAVNEVGRV